MIASEAVTRVGDYARNNTNVTSVSARILRTINLVCAEMWNGFRWSFRWRNYRIVTDTDYTTGTVTATNGSRTITGSGTTFSSSHVGWHIYFLGDSIQNWYKIRAYTSSSQIELDVPYQGTTGSSKAFVLRHFDYVLPSEPWDLGNVIVTVGNKSLDLIDPMSSDLVGPVPLSNGSPNAVSIYSSNTKVTSYSTGTVSGTINTQTITGSGTSWLANVNPGDTVTVGSNSYSVNTVDSDTQITTYQYLSATVSSSTYTITSQFQRIMRVIWPSSYNYTLDIRALRIYQFLSNNNDTNELLYRYPLAVITKASALELKAQGDVRGLQLMQEAEMLMQKAKAEDDSLNIRDHVAPIYSYRTNGHRGRIV